MNDAVKLRALTQDDLEVLSALLQDGLCTVGDIAFLAREHHFAIIFNRFRWEKSRGFWPFKKRPERVRTALHFNGVLSVNSLGYDTSDDEAILNLLSISHEIDSENVGNELHSITLNFSAGATIRLHSECIDGVLSDISDSWMAEREPRHKG